MKILFPLALVIGFWAYCDSASLVSAGNKFLLAVRQTVSNVQQEIDRQDIAHPDGGKPLYPAMPEEWRHDTRPPVSDDPMPGDKDYYPRPPFDDSLPNLDWNDVPYSEYESDWFKKMPQDDEWNSGPNPQSYPIYDSSLPPIDFNYGY